MNNTNNLLDICVYKIRSLLQEKKLRLLPPLGGLPQHWFVANKEIQTAIVLSSFEGQAGLITQAWGIVFVDPEHPKRCTQIHKSYYGESIVLNKLLKELIGISQQ